MISGIYLARGETKQVAISTFIASLINIVVNICLINYIGLFAAPVSSIAGYAAISFWRLYDVNKRHCSIALSNKSLILLIFLYIVIIDYGILGEFIISRTRNNASSIFLPSFILANEKLYV